MKEEITAGRGEAAHAGGLRCTHCATRAATGFEGGLGIALQPIFDLDTGRPFAQEALVRGPRGEPAAEVLSRVTGANRYAFDQLCRTTAIRTAAALGLADPLSINFMPNAVYEPAACISRTLQAAERHGFPRERLIFEFTESEAIRDTGHLRDIVDCYRSMSFRTAIDDFGAGYSGLALLAEVVPDIVKLDMGLVRGIDRDPTRRAILRAVAALCDELSVTLIAEGIETPGELSALRDLGLRYVQGFLLGRPQIGRLLTRPAHPLTS